MLKFLTIIILLAAVVVGYVLNEIGHSPSQEELKKYESLPYFKNGEFQSPQKMVYDFDNVRNGPANWLRFIKRSPFAPKQKLPMKKLTRADFSQTADDFALYWLGHSSVLLELDGKRILFDPVLKNAAPIPFMVPRYNKAPVKVSDLPQIDIVIISHNHYDHLEGKTVQSLKNSKFIVPLGVGAALRGWGIKNENITELGWEDKYSNQGINITAETANPFLERHNSALLSESKKISYLASRPEISLDELLKIVPRGTIAQEKDVVESVEISIKYSGYIDREIKMAEKIRHLEELEIPEGFDFDKVSGLTIECRQKFKKYTPRTIAQASRISGVSPADISVLLVYFGR